MKIYYNPKLKEIARKLRNNATLSEVLLWQQLKNKQIMGYDFHRQKPIDEYIVDFFCYKLKLIIEIDGESHNYKVEVDRKREERLQSLGFSILHFLDVDVKHNIEGVVLAIEEWIRLHTPKSPLDRGDFIRQKATGPSKKRGTLKKRGVSKRRGEIPSKKRGVSKRRGV